MIIDLIYFIEQSLKTQEFKASSQFQPLQV